MLTPSTSGDMIPDKSLIRLRGMVQDMLDPEYYVGEFRDQEGKWHSCRYLDDMTGGDCGVNMQQKENGHLKFAERKPLIVVPIPGESTWITDIQERKALESVAIHFSASKETTNGGAKRRFETVSDGNIVDMEVDVDVDVDVERKRLATIDSKKRGSTNSEIQIQPPTYSKGTALVLLDNGMDCGMEGFTNQPKLNDIVEIVGILSGLAHPLQIPRVHALLVHNIPAFEPPKCIQNKTGQCDRAAVVKAFTQHVFSGDDLAAEYLLLHLVSRVHKRIPNESAPALIGAMPLNLVTPSSTLPLVSAVLEASTSRCVKIPLTLQNLNSASWTPRRPESSPFLHTGLLQLSAGTHVVVDETVMEAGKLNEIGLRNLAALQKLIANQQVAYNFEYFDLQQPADAPVCIVSTGKSLFSRNLDTVVQVYHSPQHAEPSTLGTVQDVEAAFGSLDELRGYLASAKSVEEFTIPQHMVGQLEKDLADARHKEPHLIAESDFHTILNVARLLTISYGESTLRHDLWVKAMDLESRRRRRDRDRSTTSAVKSDLC